LGITVLDMPNFITFIGPTWPVENGSVMGPLRYVGEYAIKFIKKMQGEFIRSITPKQDMTDLFNAHTQEFIKQTVWSSNCRSWYRSKESDRHQPLELLTDLFTDKRLVVSTHLPWKLPPLLPSY
jgi:hypothetical protein